jgi:hypothetical protein
MKLSLLYEAGMSRREFLGFLGKAGAAAVGAPLGKLDLSALGDPSKLLGKAAKKYMILSPTYSHYGYGRGAPNPSLADMIVSVENAFSTLVNLTGSKMIKPLGDYDYEFGTLIDEKQFKEISAQYAPIRGDPAYDPTEHMWWFEDGISVYEVGAEASGYGDDLLDVWGKSSTPTVTNPVEQWVKEYAGYDMPNLIQGPEDVAELEKRGLKEYVPDQVQGELENAIENVRDEEEHERRKSNYPGREAGYEKEHMFDPRSSRPASALGPFESRLREILK